MRVNDSANARDATARRGRGRLRVILGILLRRDGEVEDFPERCVFDVGDGERMAWWWEGFILWGC